MSRFIPQSDMSAAELLQCSHDAQAIIAVCRAAADGIQINPGGAAHIALSIDTALKVAAELFGPVHDAIEAHEGVKGGAENRHIDPAADIKRLADISLRETV